jgi:serine protease Do
MLKFKFLQLCFFLFVFSLTNCGGEDVKIITTKEIITNSEKASFIIYCYDEYGIPNGSGSGFFINEYGEGITNYHVLEGCAKSIIITKDSIQYEIDTILKANKKKDILTFRIKNPKKKKFSSLKFSSKAPEKGDEIYCLSNPLRLENTFSNGIISNLTKEKGKLNNIQFTAPISPGSSGGAILNKKGNVVGIAKSYIEGGQNLNFGTYLNDNVINDMSEDDFLAENPKFAQRDNFIILNLKSDNDPFEVLNAIEFGENSTTFYMSFTNLHVLEGNVEWSIWEDFKEDKEENYYYTDLENNAKYFIVSSSLGTRENPTVVPLGTTLRYKQNFAKVNKSITKLSIGDPNDSRSPHWTNIDLSEYMVIDKFHIDNYQTQFAFSEMEDGNYADALGMFLEILSYDPDNFEALNMIGVVEYALGNINDALSHLSDAIDVSPNTAVTYVNRHWIYRDRGEIDEAIDDLTRAINISPDQPDFYGYRERLHLINGNISKAREDFFRYDDIYATENKRKPVRDWGGREEDNYELILDWRKNNNLN